MPALDRGAPVIVPVVLLDPVPRDSATVYRAHEAGRRPHWELAPKGLDRAAEIEAYIDRLRSGPKPIVVSTARS